MSAILACLNDGQKKAVECTEGPSLIVAGAGSGKTRVLTSRIAYILAGGCDPSRILALTFTKKAAGEMKERIALMVGEKSARRLVMGTFHSVFVRFLRQYAPTIGYPESFTIYDSSDSQSAMKTCIRELQLDDKVYKPKEVLSRISLAKNNLITSEAYRNDPSITADDSHSRKPRIADLYSLYQKKLKAAGVMDFDDILVNMNILLKENREACIEISSRFSYIMVDEYQDTNFSQYIILKRLSALHHNLCVVGDDSQSIYAFRGAKVENILKFSRDYPECKVFRLEQNYRSTQTIVDAANTLIAHNSSRIPKTCYSKDVEGESIKVRKAYNEGDESVVIASEIVDRMRREHASYQDFAILYRTNAQSRAIEETLRRRNLPYMVYSGNSFFDRMEVKDMMAYFKLCVNPRDNEAFLRAVGKPSRGIGDTTLGALATVASGLGISLCEACLRPELAQSPLKSSAIGKLVAFATTVYGWNALVPGLDAHTLATRIADESGLYAFFKQDTSIEGLSRTANVEELVSSVQSFIEDIVGDADPDDGDTGGVTLADFLENISLLSNADTDDGSDSTNKIALMTIHSAKGLEFKHVIVAGLEENLFPSGGLLALPADIEEERRLMYVAMTRAGRSLMLTYADTRMRNGRHESNAPSRFLKEIDAKYLDNPLTEDDFSNEALVHEWGGFGSRWSGRRISPPQSARPQPARPQPSQPQTVKPGIIDPDFVPQDMSRIRVGDRIEHNRFGRGTVKSVAPDLENRKVEIVFDNWGLKTILLKYAKMRFLG